MCIRDSNTTVRWVLSVTLAKLMSPTIKPTSGVVPLSPLMSQDSLLQSRRDLMSVVAFSPLSNNVSKLVPVNTRVSLTVV